LLAVVLAFVMIAAAACSDDKKATTTSSGSSGGSQAPAADAALGPVKKASGAPVNVGFISEGKTAAVDQSQQVPLAQAVVDYANEHLNGLGGHTINLVGCEAKGTPEGALDCVNQLVQKNVVALVMPEVGEEPQIVPKMIEAKIPSILYAGGSLEGLTSPDLAYSVTGSIISLSGGIGAHMLQTNLKHLGVVEIDTPNSTGALQSIVAPAFTKAGVTADVVPVAPGTADMTPDVTNEEQKSPDSYWIFGNDTHCIAAAQALKTLGVNKPIYYIPNCLSPAFIDAVDPTGAFTSTVLNLTAGDPEVELYNAVLNTYGKSVSDNANKIGGAYVGMLAFVRALETATGDLTTPAGVNTAFKAAKAVKIPLGGGNTFTCDGKQGPPPFAAMCSTYAFVTPLDKNGDATDFIKVDTAKIYPKG
jgi:branched-chain amino acid transport system substrate-binding protein